MFLVILSGRSMPQMNCTILQAFREAGLHVFQAGGRCPVPHGGCAASRDHGPLLCGIVALAVRMTRQWPRLYEAFQDGRLDRTHLQQVMADALPVPAVGQRLLLAVGAAATAPPQ